MLEAAVRDGHLERGEHVDAARFPQAARTYLADGTGLAWTPPSRLRRTAAFAVDAEIVAPVRASLARRFGVHDPVEFAKAWTRAEALAKLADVPIITWLSRHGLGVPAAVVEDAAQGRVAWRTDVAEDVVTTRAVAVNAEESRDSGVVPGGV